MIAHGSSKEETPAQISSSNASINTLPRRRAPSRGSTTTLVKDTPTTQTHHVLFPKKETSSSSHLTPSSATLTWFIKSLKAISPDVNCIHTDAFYLKQWSKLSFQAQQRYLLRGNEGVGSVLKAPTPTNTRGRPRRRCTLLNEISIPLTGPPQVG